MQKHIEAEGFDYMPYLPELYPKGTLQAKDRLDSQGAWEWWLGREVAMWEEASSGRLEAQLSALDPALIISSQLNPDTSLVARKMNVPFIRVGCCLPLYYESGVPPIWSDALPGDVSPADLELEWRCHEALLWRKLWLHRDHPIKRSDFFQFVEACGIQLAEINFRSAYGYHVESDAEMITGVVPLAVETRRRLG